MTLRGASRPRIVLLLDADNTRLGNDCVREHLKRVVARDAGRTHQLPICGAGSPRRSRA